MNYSWCTTYIIIYYNSITQFFNTCMHIIYICDHLWENRQSLCIDWNLLFFCMWKLHSCTIKKHQVLDHRWPNLVLQKAFSDSVEPEGWSFWPWVALIGLYGVPNCSLDCISLCQLLNAKYCCLSSNGCFSLSSASYLFLPPPTPAHPNLYTQSVIL